jgi:hypothetical protein
VPAPAPLVFVADPAPGIVFELHKLKVGLFGLAPKVILGFAAMEHEGSVADEENSLLTVTCQL